MIDEQRRSQISSALTIILAITLIVAVAGTVYVALFPPETAPPFTEYYLLGPEGNASDYPTDLEPGETGVVIVGISNHEQEVTDYRSVVAWNESVTQSENVTIQDGQTKETRVRLTAPAEPGRYNVSFQLYKDGSDTPTEQLRLWVTVTNERD